MDFSIKKFFTQNRPQKIIAVILAILIWALVNQSILAVKVVPNVPVRIVNLPSQQTIIDLLPNGYLSHRITLTLSGSKDVVQKIESGDLEVILDASLADSDNWVVQITPGNLVSLNPSLNLHHHITSISHPELLINFSQLITEKIPIFVKEPIGRPPEGFEFIDIWPQKLFQTLSGPEEPIRKLKQKGLQFYVDLSLITKEQLQSLVTTKGDIVSFSVPEAWKKIAIPFQQNAFQKINDPDASKLQIHFLKEVFLPLDGEIPVRVYYPPKYDEELNPLKLSFAPTNPLQEKEGLFFLKKALLVKGVAQTFLDVVRDYLEVVLIASPLVERDTWLWHVEIYNKQELEDTYLAFLRSNQTAENDTKDISTQKEEVLRKRFQRYCQQLSLYTKEGTPLRLMIHQENDLIYLRTN